MTDSATPEFIETREYRRFKEFLDACKRFRYIGLCYGPPGVGKTISARYYANWDTVQIYNRYRTSTGVSLNDVLGSHAIFHTIPVVHGPTHVSKAIRFYRDQLRGFVKEDIYRRSQVRISALQERAAADREYDLAQAI